jgi:hypothetical protein
MKEKQQRITIELDNGNRIVAYVSKRGVNLDLFRTDMQSISKLSKKECESIRDLMDQVLGLDDGDN